ncbi:aminotransferase class V-fold PLP-dependent enzyme [bacterium]|nr:aminotransferase class V-fold PLP-dependent enzyme [bacterium]
MPNIAEEFKSFVEAYPSYRETWPIDDMRSREFARLDESGETYLDFEKAAPYGRSQLRCFTRSLARTVMCPPNYSSSDSFHKKIEHCKRRFLRFFGADHEEYALLFTSARSKAVHMISNHYDFSGDSQLLLAEDSHRAAASLVRHAKQQGGQVDYIPLDQQTLTLDEKRLLEQLDAPAPHNGRRLLIFPAQSSLSGVRHPLATISLAQQRGWQVCLDATSYAPTAPLNMSRYHPEFLIVAFHKMLYLPTSLYALIIKRSALADLRHHQSEEHKKELLAAEEHTAEHPAGHRHHGPRLASENLDIANVQALELGLDMLRDVSYRAIDERTQCLTRWLTGKLHSLRHRNRQPAVILYGPMQDSVPHGPVIALNFKNAEGQIIPPETLSPLLDEAHIVLGKIDRSASGLHSAAIEGEASAEAAEQQRYWRLSLGICSNFPDVFKFWQLCKQIATEFSQRTAS